RAVAADQAGAGTARGEDHDGGGGGLAGGMMGGIGQDFGVRRMGPVRRILIAFVADGGIGFGGNTRHEPHRLDGVLADGSFGGEHDCVGAVVNGVGDVAHLGAGGSGVLDHRFQHLGGGNYEAAFAAGAADNRLLNAWNL